MFVGSARIFGIIFLTFVLPYLWPFHSVSGQSDSKKRAQGHKASFCLEDTKCDPGFEKKWNCTRGGDQGITPGCFDIYSNKLDCQWIDSSDVGRGSYFIRVQLNPGNQVAESDFRNNIAKCTVYHYGNFVIASKCWIGESRKIKSTLPKWIHRDFTPRWK